MYINAIKTNIWCNKIRLGTMVDLAIIVRSSNNSHFYQSKLMRKMNFQWICNKDCRVVFAWFSSFGQQKKQNDFHSHRLLDFALTALLFWSFILVRIIYTWLTKSAFTAYIGLSLLVRDIDDFFPSKVSVYTQQNKNTIGAKTRGLLEWIIALFLLPKKFAVNCRTR